MDAVLNLKHRTILATCGACPQAGRWPDPWATGLRVSEVVHLTPGVIDSQRKAVRVDHGKDGKPAAAREVS